MAKGRFTPAELAAYRGATVDDLLPPGVRLLIVGINPGLWTAAANAHFARPGNRFWPALHRAGVTRAVMDVSAGMTAEDAAELASMGVGITNLVPQATARADEVTPEQLAGARDRLAGTVRRHRPAVVAVLGKTAYRQAFGVRRLEPGRQPEVFEGAQLWVLPNPSGLNAHDTVESLAQAYRQAALAAGLALHPMPAGTPIEAAGETLSGGTGTR
jgi:TDG/mug DNA glycosylase family protein